MSEVSVLRRVDFDLELEVVSPLHIGCSAIADASDYPKIEGDVSAILRVGAKDDNRPYVPGSALKGAMRHTAKQRNIAELGDLLGEKTDAASGRQGALLFRGSVLKTAGNTDGLPFARDHGVFVMSRTAIHAGAGVSEPSKLFQSEIIAPGSTFCVRVRLETRGDARQLQNAFVRLLECCATTDGFALGADQSSGLGRVRFNPEIKTTTWRANPRGALVAAAPTPKTLKVSPSQATSTTLQLTCKGPYLSKDPSWTGKAAKEDPHEPQIRALRAGSSPFLTGQSISGSLRAYLEWQEACDALANQVDLPSRTTELKTVSDAANLRPSERLFGVTGWRGLLRIQVIEAKRKDNHLSSSVRIDRFSGGAIDNALFTSDADIGVTIVARFALDECRANDADRGHLSSLIADIKSHGIDLGHGINRGFGWFDAEETTCQ
jgi:CRISPR/Cas system CSM-associated protein Csm3 (group 7 of RAMP superfamily)